MIVDGPAKFGLDIARRLECNIDVMDSTVVGDIAVLSGIANDGLSRQQHSWRDSVRRVLCAAINHTTKADNSGIHSCGGCLRRSM